MSAEFEVLHLVEDERNKDSVYAYFSRLGPSMIYAARYNTKTKEIYVPTLYNFFADIFKQLIETSALRPLKKHANVEEKLEYIKEFYPEFYRRIRLPLMTDAEFSAAFNKVDFLSINHFMKIGNPSTDQYIQRIKIHAKL
jgi:hypothetical protein